MSNGRFDGDPVMGQVMMYGGAPAPAPIEPVFPINPAGVMIPQFVDPSFRLEVSKQFEGVRAAIRELEAEVALIRKRSDEDVDRLHGENLRLQAEVEHWKMIAGVTLKQFTDLTASMTSKSR